MAGRGGEGKQGVKLDGGARGGGGIGRGKDTEGKATGESRHDKNGR